MSARGTVCAVGGEESSAVPYIVCEYMSLGDLATLLRNSDPVVFRAARNPDVAIIRQVRPVPGSFTVSIVTSKSYQAADIFDVHDEKKLFPAMSKWSNNCLYHL